MACAGSTVATVVVGGAFRPRGVASSPIPTGNARASGEGIPPLGRKAPSVGMTDYSSGFLRRTHSLIVRRAPEPIRRHLRLEKGPHSARAVGVEPLPDVGFRRDFERLAPAEPDRFIEQLLGRGQS